MPPGAEGAFGGHDRSMGASFFMTTEALTRLQPNVQSDAVDLLRAFDANRDRIHAIVARVYARGRMGSYDLVAADD
jgi:Protein of unknown function (DUF1488)